MPPYHTFSLKAPGHAWVVYHDDDDCPDGKTIPRKDRELGTGYRVLCDRCRKMHWATPTNQR